MYMSDVSLIPEDAWRVIESGRQKPVLVIDCLRLRGHTSHLGVGEAAAAIRRIGAQRSYMTGFNHEVSHEEYVRMGESAGGREERDGELGETERGGVELMRGGMEGEVRWVRPAHDGLRVVVSGARVWDETYM